ncbi:MAG: DUF1648 domain-containing protein [Bacteroidota bacterium]|nr:DUF1648 domain-containing protein [Bacteroidota bacterium]
MDARPKIKLKLSAIDKVLEISGWLAFIAIWIMTIMTFSHLPNTIPTHYNLAGKADSVGGKVTILLLPVLSTILFIVLTFINTFPYLFNYPENITAEDAEKQYLYATRLIRYLRLIIVVIFGYIEYRTILSTKVAVVGLGGWFIFIFLGLIFIPIIYFISRMLKKRP